MPMSSPTTRPRFFATARHFRAWLETRAATAPELLVGYWKVDSGRPSMTWSESVDEALCFGWIDGVRRRIDDRSYQIRFTPRRPTSVWSAVNIRKYHQLVAAGRMTDAGRRAFERRREERSAVYAYEQPVKAALTAAETRAFKARRAAWAHFQAAAPGYRKVVLHWIAGAKRAETRRARLATLMAACAAGERLR